MAHNFKKVSWVVMETLRQLKHRSEVFAAMRHDHDEEFKKDFAVGDTVQVKMPFRATIREGMAYTPQNVDRITTTVTADTVIGSDIEFGTIDKLLDMERGKEKVKKEYIDKMAAKMAAHVDLRAARFAYKNTGNITGVLGTNPTTFDATSAAARQRFMELDTWDSERFLFIPPAVSRAIKGGSDGNLSRFGPVEEIKRLYKQGVLGMADGFEFYESNSLADHTAGTWASSVTLSAAPANGASDLAITCTTGDTFKEGDVIGIASVYRTNPLNDEVTTRAKTMTVTVAQDVTGAASAASSPCTAGGWFISRRSSVMSCSRMSFRATTMSSIPCSIRYSERWNPSGRVSRIVCSITLGPAKQMSAFGSAICTSPSMA